MSDDIARHMMAGHNYNLLQEDAKRWEMMQAHAKECSILRAERDAARAELAAERERARKLEADGLAKYERIHLLEAELATAKEAERQALVDANEALIDCHTLRADLAAANDHANYLAKLESDLIAERDAAEAERDELRALLREAYDVCAVFLGHDGRYAAQDTLVRIDAALKGNLK